MNRFALLGIAAAPLAVGACAQSATYSDSAEHCKAAFTRIVGPEDTAVIRDTQIARAEAADTVTLAVEVNERRTTMRCAYPQRGALAAGAPSGATEIVFAGEPLTADQVATLNRAVADNDEPFTTFRKRLPPLPGINVNQTEGKLGKPAFPSDQPQRPQRAPERN